MAECRLLFQTGWMAMCSAHRWASNLKPRPCSSGASVQGHRELESLCIILHLCCPAALLPEKAPMKIGLGPDLQHVMVPTTRHLHLPELQRSCIRTHALDLSPVSVHLCGPCEPIHGHFICIALLRRS